jgi:hypothetical protein
MKKQIPSASLLLVADAGPDADYRSEPRHYFQVPLDFTLSRRSSARQLAGLINLACWRLPNRLSAEDCHVWLLDKKGQPAQFLSGLLAVRKGEKTKKEVEALNKLLVPQVTSEQSEFECNLLVSAAATVVCYDHECDDDGDDHSEEIEYDILDNAVGHFDYSALIDSDFERGVCADAEDEWELKGFESVTVTAEIGSKLAITLPFDPSSRLSLSQQRFLHATVSKALLERMDADYEPEVFDVELWLTDDSGSPSLYLTGLFDVLEGRLSKRKLKQATERARECIPLDLLATRQAA